MTIDLTKRFEALCVGPWITEQHLTASLTGLAAYADSMYGVVINLHQVNHAVELIFRLGLGIAIAPIAFPLGNLPLEIKTLQARQALETGAGGLDFVLPVEYLKSDTDQLVKDEIQALSELAGRYHAALTCIAPLGMLSPVEQQRAAALALEFGADLKTATGLGTDTSREALAALREQAGPDLALVACGEIRLFEQVLDFLHAGATRICTPDLPGVLRGYTIFSQNGLLEA
jgi:deoxyribose-phosphate aldolase